MIGITSRGIKKIEFLDAMLGDELQMISPFKNFTKVAGWGKKSNTKKARSYAKKFNLPYLSLEDGFIRSLGLGVSGSSLLSLVVDDLGIYYDAGSPSRLEVLIVNGGTSPDAIAAMDLIKKYQLSKYNHAPCKKLPQKLVPYVLVIDQTFGDVSVTLGGADEKVFDQMLQSALDENPDAEIIIKTHPDVLAGKKKGYLTKIPSHSRIKLYTEDIAPLSLLEQVDKVYTATSQMGFEALMIGKPVVCFGLPWYAGWGLTDDRNAGITKLKIRRNKNCTLLELFEAAYIKYPRYLNPLTKKMGTIFDVINYIARNKVANDETRGEIYCLGMTLWKREVLSPFLYGASTKVHFVKELNSVPKDAQVLSWGVKYSEKGHWRMEDGFLRSVGLGSDLIRPVSLVLDKGGIYYDPFSGSDLEKIIQNQVLDPLDLKRAQSFRAKYVSMKMSKYNLSRAGFALNPQGKKVILVPGQVEDDASIIRGSLLIKTNQDLLNTVRKENPDAYIVFKPHPDVVVGNRKGQLNNISVADEIITNANIIDCIEAADEIHTMTSLSGFEALLHGKVVHCYGAPFYAGWGLTIDRMPTPHRTRRVSLDELVFASFIKYPRYVIPGVDGLVRAEDALDWVVERVQNPNLLATLPKNNTWLGQKKRRLRFFFTMCKDVFLLK